MQSSHRLRSIAARGCSARYQDGGRGSRWQVPRHSQQKQRPLGAAHLCDQVREAGGRVRGPGSGQRLHLRLAGRRVSWVPPCRPSPPLPPGLSQAHPRVPTDPPVSGGRAGGRSLASAFAPGPELQWDAQAARTPWGVVEGASCSGGPPSTWAVVPSAALAGRGSDPGLRGRRYPALQIASLGHLQPPVNGRSR